MLSPYLTIFNKTVPSGVIIVVFSNEALNFFAVVLVILYCVFIFVISSAILTSVSFFAADNKPFFSFLKI